MAPASEGSIQVDSQRSSCGTTRSRERERRRGKDKRQCLRRHETRELAGKHAGKHASKHLAERAITFVRQHHERLAASQTGVKSNKARQQSAPLPQERLAPLLWTPRTCLLQQQSNLSSSLDERSSPVQARKGAQHPAWHLSVAAKVQRNLASEIRRVQRRHDSRQHQPTRGASKVPLPHLP